MVYCTISYLYLIGHVGYRREACGVGSTDFRTFALRYLEVGRIVDQHRIPQRIKTIFFCHSYIVGIHNMLVTG